jgi:hypothetical protein
MTTTEAKGNKTNKNDITEILLKVALNTIILILTIYLHHVRCILWRNCFFFFLREGGSLIITLKKTFSCCNFLLAYLAM